MKRGFLADFPGIVSNFRPIPEKRAVIRGADLAAASPAQALGYRHGRSCIFAKSPLSNPPRLGHARRMLQKQTVDLADIRVPAKRAKTLDDAKLQIIAEDIIDNGQKTPIQVRVAGKEFILVEGLHRLEAIRALGETTIEAFLVQARRH